MKALPMKWTILVFAPLLCGCATVTRGTTEQITLNSSPAGATARTSLGHNCPSTPCTFEVSRKSEFVASFEKDGYEPQQVPVGTRVAGSGAAGFAGNFLIGGLVGMGVDVATGSTLEHYPNPIMAILAPQERPAEKGPGPRVAQRERPKAFRPTERTPSIYDEPL
jgi:hypothetical protein